MNEPLKIFFFCGYYAVLSILTMMMMMMLIVMTASTTLSVKVIKKYYGKWEKLIHMRQALQNEIPLKAPLNQNLMDIKELATNSKHTSWSKSSNNQHDQNNNYNKCFELNEHLIKKLIFCSRKINCKRLASPHFKIEHIQYGFLHFIKFFHWVFCHEMW